MLIRLFNANDLIGCGAEHLPIKYNNNDVIVMVGSINQSKSFWARRSLPQEFSTGGYHGSLLWELTVGVYCGSLTWKVITGVYHGSLPWEFTVGAYCRSLPWEVTTGVYHSAKGST